MSNYETVLYSVTNQVATISLNRPDKMNACNAQMRSDLTAALEAAKADDEVRVIILTGEGRGFGVGQDLSEGIPPGEATFKLLNDEYKPMMLAIDESEKLVIAAVHGAAAGVSGALAMNCDMVIMADNAYYYQAFINVGLIPDGGACLRIVQQMGYQRAIEMVVSGTKLPADKCAELGLVNRVVPADDLLKEAQALAEMIAEKAPLAVAASKKALKQAQGLNLPDTITMEAEMQSKMTESEDAQEAAKAFLEKRKPVFQGK